MIVEVINKTSNNLPVQFIIDWINLVVKEMVDRGVGNGRLDSWQELELGVIFMNRPDAQKLNLQYRQKEYATDILSFESFDRTSLGELVLCYEVVKNQAVAHKLSFKEECGYLVLHGILHLLGYEHENGGEEEATMFALQDSIFELIDQIK